MLKSKFRIAFFVGSFFLTLLLAMLVFRIENQDSGQPDKRIFIKEGFDFRALRSLNPDLDNPKVGAKISLADLQTSRREKLSTFGNEELLLLAVVAPDCAACKFSEDMMQNIHKTTNELGIKYLPVVFTKVSPDVDIQRYAETLGFETCVLWSSELPVPESLATMITPSHILMNKDGVILQIWLGTNKDAETRKRMTKQISSDLFLINDIVKAIEMKNEVIKP